MAAEYLARRGYRVLERNVRFPRGELDIVAQDGGTLVFVEVRTRRSRAYGMPEESITTAKQERLRALAELYLTERECGDIDCRVDAVVIELGREGAVHRIELIKNAAGG